MDPIANSPPPTNNSNPVTIVETTPETFVTDVVEPSKKGSVFVYFWTQNPACQQFTPLIERVTREAGGKVRLVKFNIQNHPSVVEQLQLQAIPAVLAFQNAAPVNGFMGPVSEDNLRQFFSRVLGAPLEDRTAEALKVAREALDAGDIGIAQAHYSDILGQDPEHAEAIAGIIESFLAAGDRPTAATYLEDVPEKLRSHPAIASVRARMELSDDAAAPSETSAALAEKLAANPKDHEARYGLALAQFSEGNHEAAIESLLEIVRADQTWNDGAARAQLLKFFEALGPEDPMAMAGRRQLSSILFA